MTNRQLIRFISLVIYLAMLSAFAPFSTDSYLASMPIIKNFFHTSASNVQLTLSLFFVSFSAGLLVWGPLSDRIGRKPVIAIGLIIFIAASLFCAASHNITVLIFARIAQAFGACCGVVMTSTIVKDRFASEQLSKIFSIIMGITMLAPMIAPIVGSYLLAQFNWQANFYFLTAFGVILLISLPFMKESYPAETRKPIEVSRLTQYYTEQIKYTPFTLCMITMSTSFATMFAFISSSSFIYINLFHIKPINFGWHFAFNAAALLIGIFFLNILREKIPIQKLILIALICSIFGSMAMILTLALKPYCIWSIMLPVFISTFGIGILYPEITSLALQHVTSHTGLATSLLGASRFILAAVVGYIMGFLIEYSSYPLAIIMTLLSTVSWFTMYIYFRWYWQTTNNNPC